MRRKNHLFLLPLFILFVFGDCSKSASNNSTSPVPTNDMELWLTKPDQSALLEKQTAVLSFGSITNSYPNMDVDAALSFQTVDGFGYTLTGGSAALINSMSASAIMPTGRAL